MGDSWFRFYNTAMDDPKVMLLSDQHFKSWVTLLCVASKMDGTIPDRMDLIGKLLRRSPSKAADSIQVLLSAGLLDRVEGGYQPHNWGERQYKSASSTERVKKYRERVRQSGGKVNGYLEYRDAVYERDGFACVYCGADENLVMDHVVPVIRGGPGEMWNLATACKACNSGKAGRDPFQASLSFRDEGYRDFCKVAVGRCNRDSNAPETETKAETERKKKAARMARFQDFWAVCPKKIARGAAEKAWLKALDLADADTLIAGMRGYAAVCSNNGTEKAFIKTPGPWLNEKRWLDEGNTPIDAGPAKSPEELAELQDRIDRHLKRGKYAENFK